MTVTILRRLANGRQVYPKTHFSRVDDGALLLPASCAPTGELESARPEQHSEYRDAHVAQHDEPPPL
jgi:hypothetical protein